MKYPIRLHLIREVDEFKTVCTNCLYTDEKSLSELKEGKCLRCNNGKTSKSQEGNLLILGLTWTIKTIIDIVKWTYKEPTKKRKRKKTKKGK